MMLYTIKTTEISQVSREHGNAMIYVLIALALFGFLTITLSRSNNQADGQDIDDEQAELYAIELIEYAASAQQVVDMMLYSGSEISDLNFVNPTSGAFNTPPHIHKVFHPQGGGLNYQPLLNSAISSEPNSGWYHTKLSNIEWTQSTALDVSINAFRIPKNICEIVNKKITGSENIPMLTVPALSDFFQETLPNAELNSVICPDCVGYPSMCVVESTGTYYNFYNIIAAQ